METFEVNQKVENGRVVVTLPERFNDKEVKVKITAEDEFGDEEKWSELPAQKKVELLRTFIGADKFPSIKVGKYDVYYQ